MKKVSFLPILILGLFALTSCDKPYPPALISQPDYIAVNAYLSQTNASPQGNMDIFDIVLTSANYIGPAEVAIYNYAQPCFCQPGNIDVLVISTQIFAGDNYLAEVKIGQITDVRVNGVSVYDVWQQPLGGKSGKNAEGREMKSIHSDSTKVVNMHKLPKKSEKFFSRL